MSEQAIVIDTNVLVSAFILPRSTARRALDKAVDMGHLLFSQSTIDEFTEVLLRRKFDRYMSLAARLDAIDSLVSQADIVKPQIKIIASRDHKDDQFLELAIAAKATCIISGDKDLLVLHPFQGIPIVSASDFLRF